MLPTSWCPLQILNHFVLECGLLLESSPGYWLGSDFDSGQSPIAEKHMPGRPSSVGLPIFFADLFTKSSGKGSHAHTRNPHQDAKVHVNQPLLKVIVFSFFLQLIESPRFSNTRYQSSIITLQNYLTNSLLYHCIRSKQLCEGPTPWY